jgi:hypothetical protein
VFGTAALAYATQYLRLDSVSDDQAIRAVLFEQDNPVGEVIPPRLRPSVLGIGATKRRRGRPFLVFNHDSACSQDLGFIGADGKGNATV